jgi:hypothetical protein|eukprot:COSAG02_NODE_1160_length_14177_cov_208.515130_9_plen_256_part_00
MLAQVITAGPAALELSDVRGANYIPSSPAAVHWDFLAPDSMFDAAVIEREVGWARSELNLNALRFRASPGSFVKDPGAFERNLRRFIAIARTNQIRVMPILFDTGDLLKPLLNASAVEAYLHVVVQSHADDDTVMGYDLCNECYFSATTRDADAKRKALQQLVLAARRLRGPRQFVTTGMGDFGRWTHEAEQVKYVDVVSFHSYDGNQSDMEQGIASVRKLARSSNKPLGFASEIMNRPWDPVCTVPLIAFKTSS